MDAYDVEKIKNFKKFGISVEAITAYEDTLLVAIKGGCLMEYSTKLHLDAVKMKQKVELSCTTHKNFSSKPVSKMEAIPECSLLIAVYDAMCNVHDLNTLELKTALPISKGVTEFAIFVQEIFDENKKIQVKTTVKLCVAIGKKLKILLWNGENFEDILKELVLRKPAKSLMWCDDILFVGFVDEYFLLKPETEEVHEVFSLGNNQGPLITRISENMVLLGHDNQSVFVNSFGRPARTTSITWSGVPHFLLYDPPYAVAVLDKYIEIRSVEPTVSIQRIDIKKVEAVCQSRNLIFLLSLHSVQMLVPRPMYERVKQLLQHKHYELAIQTINLTALSKEDKDDEINKIKAKWGVYLFCTRKYGESMHMFLDLSTDPSHVIGMFPDYLPAKLHNSLVYPEKIPVIQGDELKTASAELVYYLLEERKAIVRQETLTPFTPIMEHKRNETLKTKDQALTAIDTTLLKCYLQINEALIAPLLRQPDNKVHVKEAEKVLLQEEKFSELIILYEIHDMHEEALEMMKEQAGHSKSILSGTDMTVHYLQKLGVEHLSLIFKYAEWVFKEDPYQGLKIFTENDPVVKALPRGHVASFIEKHSPETAILYLEHVIYQWQDTTEELHYELASLLRDRVTSLYQTFMKSKRDSFKPPKAGDEPGPLGKFRVKLLQFLKTSKNYQPSEVLTRFPLDCMFEERAILLGKMRRHAQALGIYVYILEDFSQAEEYCANVYNTNNPEDRQVYLYLLRTYLHPPEPETLGLSKFANTPKPVLYEALSILENHAARIDLCQALEILPDDFSVKRLRMYLEAAFETRVAYKKLCQVQRKIEYADFLQASEERLQYNQKAIVISEDTSCRNCNRKIGKTFFAYFPDGTVVHYGCVKSHERTSSLDSHKL